MSKVRFAVAGAGHIGKRHIEMIACNPAAELISIADPLPERRREVASLNTPLFGSVDELLAQSPEFDVLSIATPNGVHAIHAMAGLSAGKHVVIEKPMALSSADCRAIIDLAEKVDRRVFCIMQNRFSPPAAWLKQLVDSNKLGALFAVEVNCFWNRDAAYYNAKSWKGTADMDGGTLFTQFSHFVDILYWLFGEIDDIQSTFADFNHQDLTEFEDSAFIRFRFTKGGMGMLNYSTAIWANNFESSLTIIAEYGTVKVGGQYMNEVQYCHVKDYTMPELEGANPANDYGPYKGSASNHNLVFDNVIEVLNNGAAPVVNATDGLKVVEMIENIYKQNPFFASKAGRRQNVKN